MSMPASATLATAAVAPKTLIRSPSFIGFSFQQIVGIPGDSDLDGIMAVSLGRSLTAVKLKLEICEAPSMVTGERKRQTEIVFSVGCQCLTNAVIDYIDLGEGTSAVSGQTCSVAMEEIKSQDWLEKAYKPEVKKQWDKLY
jgi:hypothetical protein